MCWPLALQASVALRYICHRVDHHVHLYDLRKAEEALAVLKEHKKAVSYVRFNGPDELVSA